jgi:hypothetical protein
MSCPLYYVAPLNTVRAHQDFFRHGCHMVWYDEAAELVIVKISHAEDADEMHWARQPGVEQLPHPLLDQTTELEDKHVQKLGHHGVKNGDRIHDLVKRISHPDNRHGNVLMKLQVF